MIKYLGEKVTPTQAAKIWFFSRGADGCCNPFDPDQSSCFGDTLEEMPTKKEQEKFQAALKKQEALSLIHISEPTRLRRISYAVFCLKK